MKIEINKLFPHPMNQRIYGYEDNSELLEQMKRSNRLKSIVITPNFLIISGHRRVECCKTLGITEIECEIVEGDSVKYMEIMLAENAYRVKTNIQLLKEAEMYAEIEKRKANERRIETGKQNLGHGSEEFPRTPLVEKGRTTEIVAEKIGMSESSYKRGLKVMKRIEQENDPMIEWILGETVNENITDAAILAEKPIGFIQDVIELTGGDKAKIPSAIREVEQSELKQKLHLPPGKYQVLYCDLSNNPPENLAKLPIGEIGEADSVLFIWTKPTKLSLALQLITTWGYQYKTCMIWYQDVFAVSDKAEILLVSKKGNPPMIQQTSEAGGKTEKPELVRQMISATYTGTLVELTFGESDLDGWAMW